MRLAEQLNSERSDSRAAASPISVAVLPEDSSDSQLDVRKVSGWSMLILANDSMCTTCSPWQLRNP